MVIIVTRYFERNDRFWDIGLGGTTITTTYGTIGNAGKRAKIPCSSEAEARRSMDRDIWEKTAGGYLEKFFPFPFFGTCFDHHFLLAEVLVRFVNAPTEKQRSAIVRDARVPAVFTPEGIDFPGKMLALPIPKPAHPRIEAAYGKSGRTVP
jgi:hypothetical protein